ncbi:MAG: D-alanine--D-alanine ligase [Alphaproteobacteria bacterium]|nr:D-alanine--D-alanine ligase [Alphaproteobacteria bacterium]
MKPKVVVVLGGMSSERAISLKSGAGVVQALRAAGYPVAAIDLTGDIAAFVRALRRAKPDVVFNALHGKYGEDGCIQGLLNMMKIPYTHSGVMASAEGMDKAVAKRIAAAAGVPVARGAVMGRTEAAAFPPPLVAKPNDEGSSVGVHIVRTAAEKKELLRRWPAGRTLLVEEYIPGRELSVAVLDGKPLGVIEIVPRAGFYDFKNKYSAGGARHVYPAPIPKKTYDAAMRCAALAHKALRCRGVTRSDFRLDDAAGRDPRLVFLEINTNPGMTPLSLVPEIAERNGLSYRKLVERLVRGAACDT